MTSVFKSLTWPLKSPEAPGRELSYFVGGSGPDLLYLHPASGFRVSGPLERLASKFRVWAPIVPGFDGTELQPEITTLRGVADLISEFMSAKILSGPCDVVGHSLGGWIGAWLSVLHPEQVDQLVLSAPAGFRGPDAPPLSFEPGVMLKQLYAHPEKRPIDEKPPEFITGNRDAIVYYGADESRDIELMSRVCEIDCGTLILHGTQDVRVPAEAVQMLRHEIPYSQLMYIYDAAHGLDIDQPERVGEVIEDFLMRGEAFIVKAGPAGDAGGAGA
jgi:pimeloyl-ACP methyl ester carboxylesterase